MNFKWTLYLAIPVVAFLIWQFNHFEGRFADVPSDVEKKGTDLVVGFYNVENLFDTIDDKRIDDNEFLPTSKSQWTSERYRIKLQRIARVLDAMNNGNGVDVLGVCEIENRAVLEDLVREPQIATDKYGIVHYDSPDQRGIDVALLYKQDKFKPISSKAINVSMEDEPNFKTRDILWVTG
ncbi:MAG TPA: hypothetical protein VEY71_07200, partial [Chitinophagales bacterium]|nr:hypothetical protein [Chitinophagales bacterium]